MTIQHGPDGTPIAFHDLPEEKFPVDVYAFGPDQVFVFHRRIEPYVMVEIPGTGPGSVRYVCCIYGDGTAELMDDPKCKGLS